jgi:peptide/nickel transport system substrate-binding protein
MGLMRKLSAVSLAVAMMAPFALPAPQALAETPPNILVIASQIDDIVSLDPQESFEFSGSDIARATSPISPKAGRFPATARSSPSRFAPVTHLSPVTR